MRVCIATFVLVDSVTRYAQAERVALIRPNTSEDGLVEAFNRLRGELRMHGFETVSVSDDGVPSPKELRRVSELSQSDAAIAFERVEGEATCHVWFIDRESAEGRVLSIGVPESEDTPTMLALRAVELLRSSLRERVTVAPTPRRQQSVPVRPAGTAQEVSESNNPKTPRGTSQFRGSVRVGTTFMWITSQLPASFALEPSLGYRVTERLGLALRFVFPWDESRIDGARANADVRSDLGMVELRWLALQPHPIVGIEPLLAVGLARCSAVGAPLPDSQIQGHSATAWPLALEVGLGSWFLLAPRWQFGATGGVGVLAPKPLLRVDGSDTSLGRPWLELGVGLAYAAF